MTRFVTYDPEVAARLAQAVGVHRVDLRDTESYNRKFNPALFDLVRDPHRNAALLPSSDEQVLVVRVNDTDELPRSKNRKKKSAKREDDEMREIGTQPSGFLGLHDEPVYSNNNEEEPEDPPRSLWKNEE